MLTNTPEAFMCMEIKRLQNDQLLHMYGESESRIRIIGIVGGGGMGGGGVEWQCGGCSMGRP